MRIPSWLIYTLLVILFWGFWGAFSALPVTQYGYPNQMIYIIWSLTMLVPCYFIVRKAPIDRRGIAAFYGMLIGLTGAGGQLILFEALAIGPAYLVFPIVATSPAITVILAFGVLRERVASLGWVGVFLALVSIVLLSIPGAGNVKGQLGSWLILAVVVSVCWGVQAFLMKRAANASVPDGTTFFYMTISGLVLIPVAWFGMHGDRLAFPWQAPLLTAVTQLLNAVGALFLVMAMSRGKAVVVAPSTNALAPVLTVVLSLIAYQAIPGTLTGVGMVFAILGSALVVYTDARPAPGAEG